jgi:hypothetical protein
MAEKRTIELEIQDNSKSLKAQYKEAVVELQRVAAAYGETSTQAVNAAKKAAELKDQIEDTNDLMKSFKGEGAFIAMGKAMSAVANGFSAVEGGLGLIGVESENVQATMLKVQSAMALAQGLEGLEDAGRAFKNLGTVIKSTAIGQAVLTAATAAYNIVVGTSTGLMKAFRIAMLSTGIGALVVGIGLLIANFDKVINLFSPLIEGFKAIGDFIGFTNFAAEKKAAEDQKRTDAELKQINAIRKAREKNFNNEQAGYDREIKLQQALGKSTLELQKAKINASIKYQETRKKELEQDLVAFQFAQKILGENLVDTSDIENKIAELGNKIEDQKTELKILDIEAKKSQQTTSGSGGGSSPEKQAKDKLDLTRSNEDKRLALLQDGYEKELALAKEKAKREKEDLEANSKGKIVDKEQYAAAQKLIDDNLTKDLKAIDDKYNKEARERKIENDEWFKNYEKQQAEERLQNEIKRTEDEEAAIQKRDENRIQARFSMLTDEQLQEYNSKKEFNDSLAELDRLKNEGAFKTEEEYLKAVDILQDDYNKKDIARKNELRQKTLDLTAKSFSALAELAGSFNTKNEKDARKQFQVQKAFNLAAAITNTAMAVTGALTAGGNPIKLATGMQFVEAGIAATVGAANIIKISNSKFGGGANSGGGGNDTNVPTAAPMTANFNTIGSSGINQLAQLQQTPTQAYVVSGEVTSAQALDRNRVQNATL